MPLSNSLELMLRTTVCGSLARVKVKQVTSSVDVDCQVSAFSAGYGEEVEVVGAGCFSSSACAWNSAAEGSSGKYDSAFISSFSVSAPLFISSLHCRVFLQFRSSWSWALPSSFDLEATVLGWQERPILQSISNPWIQEWVIYYTLFEKNFHSSLSGSLPNPE